MTRPLTTGASMLEAFKAPDATGSPELIYPNLDRVSSEAKQKESVLLEEFWEAPEGSLEEEKQARAAALGYLILTGQQLRRVRLTSQPLISERFTQSSVELYGAPEKDIVQQLIFREYTELSELVDNENVDQSRLTEVLEVLKGALEDDIDTTATPEEESILNIAEQFKDILNMRYGDALGLLDQGEDGEIRLELGEIQSLFQQGLDILATNDSSWNGWTAEVVGGEGFSASTINEKINIGNRGDYPIKRLKALFAHEVLNHALRSINGRKHDELLGRGLPGNLDMEEGIGVFFEFAIDGVMPDKNKDRYIGISLALGQMDLPAMTREQLNKFMSNTRIVRRQAAGETVNTAEIEAKTRNTVDRIYRGSLGNEIIGVNTKDIAYYDGFVKVARYLKQEIEDEGKSAESVFDYIMQGCFNPADARHQAYVASHKKK